MNSVGIIGMGSYLPERIVTNQEIAQKLGMTERAIKRKTGILQRRWEKEEITLTEMSVIAAQRALEDAKLSPDDIGMIIIATNTHDRYITAALVQDQLGATRCAGLDLHSGCSSFITGLVTGAQYVQTQLYPYVLVVAVDKCTSIINHEDRQTALLFADGASAVVIGNVSKGKGILGVHMQMDGSGGKYLHLNEQKQIQMDGQAVYDFAIHRFPEAVKTVLRETNLSLEEVDFIIPHQANLKIIEKGAQNLGYPIEKVATHVVQYYGNSSAPTIPLALHEEVNKGTIKEGDLIVLVGYGAGLGWGSVALRWGR